MINIFDYDDYREYLKAYFKFKKAQGGRYSYRTFSDKAGFNRTFIHAVMNGSKNLGKTSIAQFSQALGHNKKEQEYFENLVGYNQTDRLALKDRYYDNLKSIKSVRKGSNGLRLLRQDQFDYYSQWYHAVIRSLINQRPFKDDFAWLARNVRPAIKVVEAKKSVELLERLGLIIKQAGGIYKLADKSVSTGHQTLSHAVLKFHQAMAGHALRAISELPRDKRFLTGLTLGISRRTYEALCEKIQDFVSESLLLAEQDDDADSVYHVNFQMFPVSQPDSNRRPE